MRVSCVYAHKTEVEHLKNLVNKTNWSEKISWHRWSEVQREPTATDFSETDAIINAGFAGRLSDRPPLETLVLVDQLIDPVSGKTVQLETANKSLGLKPCLKDDDGFLEVNLLTVDKPVIKDTKKKNLLAKFDAAIVDMEAWDVYHLSKKVDIPFVSFKLISDNADDTATNTVITNKHKLGRLLGETLFNIFETLSGDRHGYFRNHTGI